MTEKKCTKKRDARAKIVVLLIEPIAFVAFKLLSPSSDLKVPIVGIEQLRAQILKFCSTLG